MMGKSSKGKWFTPIIVLLISIMFLVSCNQAEQLAQSDQLQPISVKNEDTQKGISVAIVTDTGGVDDSSFNQSGWEGLKEWAIENNLTQGVGGYDYLESNTDGEYLPHLRKFVEDDFDLIFGLGFLLDEAIQLISEQYPETMFAIVDTVVNEPNVASITFAEHEGSFLVGVAAALKTKTNKIGFIGGVDSPVINKFEVGFIAGVHSINPNITIDVKYAEDFNAFDKGKSLAKEMFENDIDIIYHAAGGTGNGVIAEAKEQKLANEDKNVWVIGVDRDQYAEGLDDDLQESVVYTSMVKRVDVAVKQISQQTLEGNFPGGEEIVFGLENKGILVADTNKEAYTEDIKQIVDEWETKIKSKEVVVPETRDELENFIQSTK